MTAEDDATRAALYALGVLSGQDYELAARRAANEPAFADAVAAWEARLVPLTLALPPVEPSAGLLEKIEGRISAAAPSKQRIVVRATEGTWHDWLPGIRLKVLHRKPEIGRQTILVEMAPGSTGTVHSNDDDEECYVVSGDISFGEHLLGPGDFHLSPKGSTHPAAHSVGGCLCIFVMAMH
jgi:quercetin dioxygenase-like cupin family protein